MFDKITHYHFYKPDPRINSKLNKILMKQTEVAAELVAVKEQAVKAKAEVMAKLAELETAIGNQENASPEVEAALAELKTAVGDIDNLIEDTTTPPVEPEA